MGLMIILVALSIKPVKRNLGSIFIKINFYLFISLLVFLAIHCHGFGWLGWAMVPIVLFVVIHVSRLARRLFSGVVCFADVTVFDGALRLDIVSNSRWGASAGTFAYIQVLPNVLQEPQHFTVFTPAQSLTRGLSHVSIVISPEWNQNLYNSIREKYDQTGTKQFRLKMILDGPYGSKAPLEDYENVVFITDGINITSCYNYATYINDIYSHGRKSHALYIKLIWILDDPRSIIWFQKELSLLVDLRVLQLSVYISDRDGSHLRRGTDFEFDADHLKRWILEHSTYSDYSTSSFNEQRSRSVIEEEESEAILLQNHEFDQSLSRCSEENENESDLYTSKSSINMERLSIEWSTPDISNLLIQECAKMRSLALFISGSVHLQKSTKKSLASIQTLGDPVQIDVFTDDLPPT